MDAAVTLQERRRGWRLCMITYLTQLRGRVSIADADCHDTHEVRIGRAPDDQWLEIHWYGQLRNHGAYYLNGSHNKLNARDVREAMVLLRVMAHVDPCGSLGRLQRAVAFEIPTWMDVVTEPLQCQFLFNLDKRTNFKDCGWRSLLGGLVDINEPSKEFVHLYKMMSDPQLQPMRANRAPLKIPIQLRFSPLVRDMPVLAQAQLLQQFERVVLKLLDENCASSTLSGDRDLIPVQFCLDSIELDLRDFTIASAVFRGILGVLKAGALVKSLTLPQVDDCVDLTEIALRSSWALLSCMICGVRFRSSNEPITTEVVGRVVMPKVYATSSLLFQPFFSALHLGQGIQTLRVELFLEWHRRASGVFWSWFAYGVHQSISSSSVTTLNIDRITLADEIVSSMTRIVDAQEPTSALWGATSGDEDLEIERLNRVVMRAMVPLKPLGMNSTVLIMIPQAWPAIIVQDDPARHSVCVLVPGFGFCEVNRSTFSVIPNVASEGSSGRNVQTRRSIDTLILGCHGAQNTMNWRNVDSLRNTLIDIVGLFGREVNHLSLRCGVLDDRTVQECVAKCRNVSSLRVSGGWYDSMEWLLRLCVAGHRITSLELHDTSLETHHLNQILRRVLAAAETPQCVMNTLSRLRICAQGKPLMTDPTADLLQRVVEDAVSLSHFFVYYGRRQVYKEMPPSDETSFRMKGKDVHPLSVKLAFVSVAGGGGSCGALNPDTMGLIFAFMGLKRRRIVIVSDAA